MTEQEQPGDDLTHCTVFVRRDDQGLTTLEGNVACSLSIFTSKFLTPVVSGAGLADVVSWSR